MVCAYQKQSEYLHRVIALDCSLVQIKTSRNALLHFLIQPDMSISSSQIDLHDNVPCELSELFA